MESNANTSESETGPTCILREPSKIIPSIYYTDPKIRQIIHPTPNPKRKKRQVKKLKLTMQIDGEIMLN
jgi:hypothetical protein